MCSERLYCTFIRRLVKKKHLSSENLDVMPYVILIERWLSRNMLVGTPQRDPYDSHKWRYWRITSDCRLKRSKPLEL